MLLLSCNAQMEEKETLHARPNFLVIAIDDLNDWIGCLGGHPQAKTPNIDRLASMGMVFSNAHCQSPVCNPSRASLMTSLYPSTTGIYFLNPGPEASEVARRQKMMPQRFAEEGYYVTGAGKLFHNGGQQNEKNVPNYGGKIGGFGPMPEQKLSPYPGHPLWDWGVFPNQDSLMPDHKIADWAVRKLMEKHDSALWMGIGFYRPHVPQYAPQKWFDLYPLDSIQLPEVIDQDLEDISSYGHDITRLEHVSPTHDWVVQSGEWSAMVQSYLACVSFVDHQVGKVLDAWEQSPYAEDGYVVLWSDHGFHIGEKERHAKRSLWEDGTRVPLIIAGPGIAKSATCQKPVELLDIYPTLIDLAKLSADSTLEGQSLVPLLQDPSSDWPYFARTSFGPGNYGIKSEQFRFIQYVDGSEEFYDHLTDPHEWNNLIEDPSYQQIIGQHRHQIPATHHDILGEGSTGHKSFAAAKKRIIDEFQ